ncbi:MAG: hypothetical protein ACK449_18300, partial [Planctomycetota bacterium]
MQRELALQFRLSAGPPLLKPYIAEQSWPTRDAGSKVAGTLRCAVSLGIDVQLIQSSERHMECAYYLMLTL